MASTKATFKWKQHHRMVLLIMFEHFKITNDEAAEVFTTLFEVDIDNSGKTEMASTTLKNQYNWRNQDTSTKEDGWSTAIETYHNNEAQRTQYTTQVAETYRSLNGKYPEVLARGIPTKASKTISRADQHDEASDEEDDDSVSNTIAVAPRTPSPKKTVPVPAIMTPESRKRKREDVAMTPVKSPARRGGVPLTKAQVALTAAVNLVLRGLVNHEDLQAAETVLMDFVVGQEGTKHEN